MKCSYIRKFRFCHTHCDHHVYCGKRAVASFGVGISGQLNRLFVCREHVAWAESKGAMLEPV